MQYLTMARAARSLPKRVRAGRARPTPTATDYPVLLQYRLSTPFSLSDLRKGFRERIGRAPRRQSRARCARGAPIARPRVAPDALRACALPHRVRSSVSVGEWETRNDAKRRVLTRFFPRCGVVRDEHPRARGVGHFGASGEMQHPRVYRAFWPHSRRSPRRSPRTRRPDALAPRGGAPRARLRFIRTALARSRRRRCLATLRVCRRSRAPRRGARRLRRRSPLRARRPRPSSRARPRLRGARRGVSAPRSPRSRRSSRPSASRAQPSPGRPLPSPTSSLTRRPAIGSRRGGSPRRLAGAARTARW